MPETPETRDSFTQKICEPLADHPELHLLAVAEVQEATQEHWDKDALIVRLDTNEPSKGITPRWLKWSWGALIAIFSILVVVGVLRGYRQYQIFGAISSNNFSALQENQESKYSQREEVILNGDRSATDPEKKWKKLWQLDEENPRYAIPYFESYFDNHGLLPPEAREMRETHDSDNAWYALREAAHYSKESLTKKSSRSPNHKPGTPWKASPLPTFEITNQAKYEEAISALKSARGSHKLTDYSQELWKERIAILNYPSTSFLEQSYKFCYAASIGTHQFHYLKLSELISVYAHQLAENGDAEEFRALVEQNDFISQSLVHHSSSLIGALVSKAYLSVTYRVLSEASVKLELGEMNGQLKQRAEAYANYIEASRNRPGNTAHQELTFKHSSTVSFLSGLRVVHKASLKHVELTQEELYPSLRVEHSLVAKVASTFLAQILIITAGLILFRRFVTCRIGNALGKCMLNLLTRSQILLLVVKSSLLPFLFFILLRYLTPLGGLDYGAMSTLKYGSAHLIAPYLFLLCSFLIIPAIESRLMVKHLFGQPIKRLERLPIYFVICGMLTTAGLILFEGALALAFLFLNLGLLITLLILTFVYFLRSLSRKSPSKIYRSMRLQLFMPCLLIASILMIFYSFVSVQEESYWVQKDRLSTICQGGFCTYEEKVIQQLRAELLELLKPL